MSERLHTTSSQSNRWDVLISTQMPGSALFRAVVGWFPAGPTTRAPSAGMPDAFFVLTVAGYLGVVALLFVLYGLALGWLARHPTPAAARPGVLLVIGGAGLMFSALLLLSPSAPSHDPIAYGSGGQLLGTYRANPYFVLPAAFPHDPLLAANEWPKSAEAYGPLWTLLSTLLSPLVADDPLRSIMVYRLVAFVAHVANVLLLLSMPRALPTWPRAWRERGLLLYAWNPLIVMQVAAGHNDVVMLTFLLLGLYALGHGRLYLAALGLGAAILIKATAAPLVLPILGALWIAAWPVSRCPTRARALATAATLAGVVCLGYLPFLWGYSPHALAQASRLQPTAQSLTRALAARYAMLPGRITAFHSIPRALAAALAYLAANLARPQLWTGLIALCVLAVICCVLPAARQRLAGLPAALAAVYAVPLVFLSFFQLLQPWYVVPLVALVCLSPKGRAIRRFALTLTVTLQLETAFLVQGLPPDGWLSWRWALVVGIPLVVLLVSLRRDGFRWRAAARRSGVAPQSARG